VTGGDDELVRRLRTVCVFGKLFARAVAELEAVLPVEKQPARRAAGRPRVVPTAEQVAGTVWLRHHNGKLGYAAIGERVGLNKAVVQRILDEHAPSEKPPGAVRKT
jgi:hypothetical protein